jgi:hypothetical protein
VHPELAFLILLVAAGAVEVARRLRSPDAMRLRAFRKAAVSSVSNARNAIATKVEGAIERRDEVTTAPISGVPCVAYRIDVWRIGNRDQSEPTTRIVQLVGGVAFAVRDETGIAIADPRDGEVLLLGRAVAMRCAYGKLPDGIREQLAKRGYDRAEFGGLLAPLECHEVTLAPGDRAQLYGTAQWEADKSGASGSEQVAFRGSPRALRIRGGRAERMILAKV